MIRRDAALRAIVSLALVIVTTVPAAAEPAREPPATPHPRVPAADGRERFLLDGAAAVDRATGLTWQRCSVGQRWEVNRGCIGLATKLWFDEALRLQSARWRLPTTQELRSLHDADTGRLADPVAFPDAPPTWYWARGSRGQAEAWGPSCGDGGNDSCYQNDARAVRLVRRADGRK